MNIQSKPSSRNRFILYLGVAWIVCLFIQVSVLRQYQISFVRAFIDATISNGLLCFYSILTILVFRYSNTTLKDNYQRILWVIVLTALIVFQEKWLIHFLIADENYCLFYNQHLYLRLCITALFSLLITMLTWMWYYFKEQQEVLLKEEKIQQTLKESELNKLRQQLQPHFLFNSLNSISSLVVTEPKQARKMIQNLSDFLRGTIKKEDNQLTTLKDELHVLDLYLSIEKIRFGHRLQTEIKADDKSLAAQLPPLLLQPLLENSIKFGLYDVIGEVSISLNAHIEANYLHIEIKNPFDSTTSQTRQGEGFGLSAIQRRLFLIYGRNDLLQITKHENTFICHLRIPQNQLFTTNPTY
jgi:two-component system, LytTR family, sensor kinase